MSEKENLRQELLDLNKKRDEIEKQILSYQSVLKSVSDISIFFCQFLFLNSKDRRQKAFFFVPDRTQ